MARKSNLAMTKHVNVAMRQAVVKLKVLFIMREIHVWCNQGNDAIRMRTSLKDNAINGISEYRNIGISVMKK